MKVVVIAGKFPARSETFISEHVVGLAARNHQVTVLSCGVDENIFSSEVADIDRTGVRRINISCFGQNKFGNLLRLLTVIVLHPQICQYLFPKPPWTRREMFWAHSIWKLVEQLNYDIIHIHFGNKAGPLVRYKLPRRTVVTWHGYDNNCLPCVRGENMYRELFNTSVKHTVGTVFMQQRLKALGATNEQITQVPMGIDLDRFIYKERCTLLINPLRIVSVGRLDEMKGHTFLIQAVSELLNEGANIELRIIGSGSLKDKLDMQIVKSQHSSEIRLLGAKTSIEVVSELHAAHLFCLTGIKASSGRVETQGVVFAEAQATGLPVVGTSVGGVPDSLIEGQTGLLCPPGDVSAIKRAIRFFLEYREAINEFGQRGRAFVESKFALSKMIDSFEDIYQSLL
ncbi:glycosyltransferase [Myxosarcina sp. GI1(2024)]